MTCILMNIRDFRHHQIHAASTPHYPIHYILLIVVKSYSHDERDYININLHDSHNF